MAAIWGFHPSIFGFMPERVLLHNQQQPLAGISPSETLVIRLWFVGLILWWVCCYSQHRFWFKLSAEGFYFCLFHNYKPAWALRGAVCSVLWTKIATAPAGDEMIPRSINKRSVFHIWRINVASLWLFAEIWKEPLPEGKGVFLLYLRGSWSHIWMRRWIDEVWCWLLSPMKGKQGRGAHTSPAHIISHSVWQRKQGER